MSEVASQGVVVLDVGGTTVSAAVVVGDEVTSEPVRGPSRQGEDAATIIEHLAATVSRAHAGSSVVVAVVAMPAPFDYVAGVSHMEHKFAALRDVELGAALQHRTGLAVHFVNDAEAASIGCWIGFGRPVQAVGCITLGTGVGSGLVIGGEFAGHNEIWCQPYRDGIVENLVSSHALSDSYRRRTGHDSDVAAVAARADAGDDTAVAVLAEFGEHLGTAAASYFADAAPAMIACAGGITGAWNHIEPAAAAAYCEAGGVGTLVKAQLADPALVGGAELGRRHLRPTRSG